MKYVSIERTTIINIIEKTIREYVAVEKKCIAFTKAKKRILSMIIKCFNKELNYHYTGNYLSYMIEIYASMLGDNRTDLNSGHVFYEFVNFLILKYDFKIDTLQIN